MIISLGYRVKSSIATKFRIWATNVLKAKFKKENILLRRAKIIEC